jgi:hypothetical protein
MGEPETVPDLAMVSNRWKELHRDYNPRSIPSPALARAALYEQRGDFGTHLWLDDTPLLYRTSYELSPTIPFTATSLSELHHLNAQTLPEFHRRGALLVDLAARLAQQQEPILILALGAADITTDIITHTYGVAPGVLPNSRYITFTATIGVSRPDNPIDISVKNDRVQLVSLALGSNTWVASRQVYSDFLHPDTLPLSPPEIWMRANESLALLTNVPCTPQAKLIVGEEPPVGIFGRHDIYVGAEAIQTRLTDLQQKAADINHDPYALETICDLAGALIDPAQHSTHMYL